MSRAHPAYISRLLDPRMREDDDMNGRQRFTDVMLDVSCPNQTLTAVIKKGRPRAAFKQH